MIKQSQFSSMYTLLKLSQNHFTCGCMCVVPKPCPTLCDLMDCSPPGSCVHEIFQARILEWVAISFSWLSSQPRDWTWVSCIADRFSTDWATREAHSYRHPNVYIVERTIYLHAEFLTTFLTPRGPGYLAAKYKVGIISLSGADLY